MEHYLILPRRLSKKRDKRLRTSKIQYRFINDDRLIANRHNFAEYEDAVVPSAPADNRDLMYQSIPAVYIPRVTPGDSHILFAQPPGVLPTNLCPGGGGGV